MPARGSRILWSVCYYDMTGSKYGSIYVPERIPESGSQTGQNNLHVGGLFSPRSGLLEAPGGRLYIRKRYMGCRRKNADFDK